nr:rna-dependent rna polymerase 1 [Quercus suber]
MPPPVSPTLAIKNNNAPTVSRPSILPLLSTYLNTSFSTSAMTSFTSVNKSFSSVFSEMKASQETVATVATSVCEEDTNVAPPDKGIRQLDPQTAGLQGPEQSPGSKHPMLRTQTQVKNILKDGIANELPESMLSLPYPLRIAAYRASRHCNISLEEIDEHWSAPRTRETLLILVDRLKAPTSRQFNIGKEAHCWEHPLLARLMWNEAGDRVFKLELEPFQSIKPNIYERHFGAHRFLIVDCCPLGKPTGRFATFSKAIQEQACIMLGREQNFLGRTWIRLLPKDRKGEKDSSNNPDTAEPGTYKMFFFATSGDGLEPISITQLVDWYMPIHLNIDQPASKAFSRLELALSRGSPAYTFSRDQIRYGNYGLPDIKANDTPEVWPDRWIYDDHQREQDFDDDNASTQEVMSDGCARISIAAMDCVRKGLKLDYIPSAVQARIFGAKGVWYCAGGELPIPIKAEDVWIEITKSQVKVRRDINAETDEELRSLEVLKSTHNLSTSYLYTGFMPIMVDRGVPKQTILDLASSHIRTYVDELMDALGDPSLFHRWLHGKRDLVHKREREMEMWLADRAPDVKEERVVKMLEHGFKPGENAFLDEEMTTVIRWLFDNEVKSSRLPLSKSTSAIGIADLSGILNPGEIQVNFSKAIDDPSSDQSWSTLQDVDVLVARNPAQRDSDIQKVRAVYRKELSHLKDVIIFSTKGRRPLASKLSGGDYDGDTFVVYWCEELVQPFRNAPAPRQLTPLEEMYISVDREKLADIVPSARFGLAKESEMLAFIRRQSKARMQFSYLGVVSNAYGELTYPNNDLSTEAANKYNDLHDYLVDADKNGYSFTENDLTKFRARHNISQHPQPQYRKFLKSVDKSFREFEIDETGQQSKEWIHILDKFYFEILMREVVRGMKRVNAYLPATKTEDTDLESPYDQVWKSANELSVLRAELESLNRKFKPLEKAWKVNTTHHVSKTKQQRDWIEMIKMLQKMYQKIKPDNLDHPAVVEWCRPQGNAPSMWEKLKASAFAKFYHKRHSMLYNVAGDDLCKIKSQANAYRCITIPVYINMKPKKRKRGQMAEDLRDALDKESDFGDTESLLDVFDEVIRAETESPATPRTSSIGKRLQRDLAIFGEEREEPESPSKRVQSSGARYSLHGQPPAWKGMVSRTISSRK